ncbi:uncharacterized protein F4822DRAFT_425900 [Hypoxylon trugodes]|uniref:uncharacterized protein n=1 Tax=Hypoxylon trugodes TaxID=326681 RepID=UPI0021922030|nr:uncharacterized protein F4822DRAFT_425900 [Hypoxylon trugodes]KAI1392697.1 hypothetical protein F4822DRAFT_425900 [Hypoxylon trugodes]
MTQEVPKAMQTRPNGGTGEITDVGSIAGIFDRLVRRRQGEAVKVYASYEPLTPADVAEVIVFVAARRENVVLADSSLFPSRRSLNHHAIIIRLLENNYFADNSILPFTIFDPAAIRARRLRHADISHWFVHAHHDFTALKQNLTAYYSLTKLNPGVTVEQKGEWETLLKDMLGKVPGLVSLEVNSPLALTAHRSLGFSLGFNLGVQSGCGICARKGRRSQGLRDTPSTFEGARTSHLRALERRATISHGDSPGEPDPVLASASASASAEDQRGQYRLDTEMRDSNISGHGQEKQTPGGFTFTSSGRTANADLKEPPASVWKLSQDVCRILGTESGGRPSHAVGDTEESRDSTSAVNLPEHDYIVYLAHIVDFHLHAGCLFDGHTISIPRGDDTAPGLPHTESKIWVVQVSAVVALGRLFLEKGATGSRPPGFQEFLQGSDAVPSNTILLLYPLLAIEALCLLSVYAHSADMHAVAYLYIAQTIAIARCRNLDDQRKAPIGIESDETKTARRLWHTVCILDRRYSAAIGMLPNYPTQDVDNIFLDESSGLAINNTSSLNLTIACRLSRIIMLHSKHHTIDTKLSPLTEEIMAELRCLHLLGRSISVLPHFRFGHSLHAISRPAATLHLLYCHCVIIAAQPILLYLLRRRLSSGEPPALASSLLETSFAVLRSCANAANFALDIIAMLHDQNLLEIFFFSNVEITFLAALALILIDVVLPAPTGSDRVGKAIGVLHDMGRYGSATAIALGADLKRIHEAVAALSGYPRNERGTEVTTSQDGDSFNVRFLNLIETPNPPEKPAGRPETLQGRLETMAKDPDVQFMGRGQGTRVTTQSSTGRSAPQQTAANMVHAEESPSIALGEAEDAYSFDMLNLEWLEYVQ